MIQFEIHLAQRAQVDDCSIRVIIKCGCGWNTFVTSTDGKESHYELWEIATRLLANHIGTGQTTACMPWSA